MQSLGDPVRANSVPGLTPRKAASSLEMRVGLTKPDAGRSPVLALVRRPLALAAALTSRTARAWYARKSALSLVISEEMRAIAAMALAKSCSKEAMVSAVVTTFSATGSAAFTGVAFTGSASLTGVAADLVSFLAALAAGLVLIAERGAGIVSNILLYRTII